MSKEFRSNMRLKKQTSLRRLTSRKKDSLKAKPSLIAFGLIFIALMQVPIALKASFSIVCMFSETNNKNQTLFFCND